MYTNTPVAKTISKYGGENRRDRPTDRDSSGGSSAQCVRNPWKRYLI